MTEATTSTETKDTPHDTDRQAEDEEEESAREKERDRQSDRQTHRKTGTEIRDRGSERRQGRLGRRESEKLGAAWFGDRREGGVEAHER